MTRTSKTYSDNVSTTDSYGMRQSSVIYVPKTGQSIEDWLTSLRQDSPANRIASQEIVQESRTRETSGLIPEEPLARWDQATSSWRTCQASLLTGMGEELSGIFPKWGMTVGGALYQQETLAHRISGSDGSASLTRWMTPNTLDSIPPKSQQALDREATIRKGRSRPNNLRDQVAVEEGTRLWPTPSATPRGPHTYREVTDGGQTVSKTTGTKFGMTLETAIKHWPTPTANEDAAGTPNGKMQKMLGNHPDIRGDGVGTLNPDWVAWIMGLPPRWDCLDPLPESEYLDWLQCQIDRTWWLSERDLPRVSTGVKRRTNRLKALGNGIVPLQAAIAITILSEGV